MDEKRSRFKSEARHERDVWPNRRQQLKCAVDSGDYNPSSEDIAEKMVDLSVLFNWDDQDDFDFS